MTTDPASASSNRSAEDVPDPDSLPIDPGEVTQKALERDCVIEAEFVTTDTSKA